MSAPDMMKRRASGDGAQCAQALSIARLSAPDRLTRGYFTYLGEHQV